MIEPAIILVRLLQYVGAAILFGSSLFFVHAAPSLWPRRWLAGSAALLALSSVLAIGLQASLFAGSPAAGFTVEAMGQVIAFMDLGKAAAVRAAVSALALGVILLGGAGRGVRPVTLALGALATASLAWLGHGAASDSAAQLVADIVHALTAAAWVGALAGLGIMLANARDAGGVERLLRALRRFSALGVPLVAALVLSGLVNGFYTVGLDRLSELPSTPYGRLLLLKLAAFAGMLALAAHNRNRLTPALAADPGSAGVARLGRSIGLEALLGLAVLALVAWFGTLEPPVAG